MLIVTIAEDTMLTIVTNASALLCRRLIGGGIGKVIVGETWFIESISDFPLRIVIELTIDEERVNLVT